METLLVDRDDRGIVTVTLNRPTKKNAINGPMWDELLAVFREIQASTTDRVVILTGTAGAFCSGADVTEMANGPRRHWLQQMRYINEVALALHRIPQPTIAKVNGVAAGAGANMAFGCDLIVAGSSARFSEIFHRRGLSVDFGGSWLLPRLVGLHKAKELAFFADIISATDALELGVVNRVVADSELDAFVAGWASRLADGPPLAMSETKRMLNNALHTSFDQTLEEEAQAQALNFTTNDTKEAMLAFVDKREPRFKGY
jgi:enoyl-CoA hydratase/carnithine racemase